MTLTDQQWAKLEAAAVKLGTEMGTMSDHACDLSGEWADRPGGPEVLQAIYDVAAVPQPNYLVAAIDDSDLLDKYEEAYNLAAGIIEAVE